MSIKHKQPDVDERLLIQSVIRALDILEAFSELPEAMSLGEISRQSGINKSGVQRLAHTLYSRGYLERSDKGGFQLGRQFLDRSFDYLRSNPIVERAMPILTDLRKTAGERVDLSLFDAFNDNLSIVYAIRMQSKRETFYATLAGRRIPSVVATGGRACLALLDDDLVDQVIRESGVVQLTRKTRTHPDEIWNAICEAREIGYAYAEEEALLGELALAAAIKDSSGVPIGAIHVAGSLSEWTTDAFRQKFSPLVIEATRALSM